MGLDSYWPDVAWLRPQIAIVHGQERAVLATLTDDDIRAASALPGWTRGHVLAARRAFLRAAVRQFRTAAAEFYDGGRTGRDAEIERWTQCSAAKLSTAVRAAQVDFETELQRTTDQELSRPATYRGPATLLDIVVGDWREAELHRVDLGIGIGPSSWSDELCTHLFAFLAPRVPDGMTLALQSTNGEAHRIGDGPDVVEVAGAKSDLAAWLAGREPEGPLSGPLPQLRRLRDAQTQG